MKNGILMLLALIASPAITFAQGNPASSSRKAVTNYGQPEIANVELIRDFTDYAFLVDYNVFSQTRGPKVAPPPPPPPPPPQPTPVQEKRYILAGVAQEGDDLFAYIETANDPGYVFPLGVNDTIAAGMGVIKSIDLDGIVYQKKGASASIKISVGYDLAGEPAYGKTATAASVADGSIEKMLMDRRDQMLKGTYVPSPSEKTPAVQPMTRTPQGFTMPQGFTNPQVYSPRNPGFSNQQYQMIPAQTPGTIRQPQY